MIVREAVENDRGDRERLVAKTVDVRMESQQAMLAVNGAKDTFAFRHFQGADRRPGFGRLELQRLVTGDDDGARNGRQVPGLTALLVVLDQLVNLLADDLPLVRLLIGGDPAFE